MKPTADHDGRIDHEHGAVREAIDAVERIVEESRREGRGVSRRHAEMTQTTGRRRDTMTSAPHPSAVDSFNTTTTSLTVKRKRERESGNDHAVSLTRERTGVSVEAETR